MSTKSIKSLLPLFLVIGLVVLFNSCFNSEKKPLKKDSKITTYPSDVIPFLNEFTILLGDGTRSSELIDFQKMHVHSVAQQH